MSVAILKILSFWFSFTFSAVNLKTVRTFYVSWNESHKHENESFAIWTFVICNTLHITMGKFSPLHHRHHFVTFKLEGRLLLNSILLHLLPSFSFCLSNPPACIILLLEGRLQWVVVLYPPSSRCSLVSFITLCIAYLSIGCFSCWIPTSNTQARVAEWCDVLAYWTSIEPWWSKVRYRAKPK